MISLTLAALLAFQTRALAKPAKRYDAYTLHESIPTYPSKYAMNGAAKADMPLELRIALVPSDMEGLERATYDVSTPSSPTYGQYLSKEQVESFVKPSDATVADVNEWLASHGLMATSLTPAGEWLKVSLTASQANTLLDTQYLEFTDATGATFVRTLQYSIPSALKDSIELIHPTITFPVATSDSPVIFSSSLLSSGEAESSCTEVVTPHCIEQLYSIPITVASQPSNTLAVWGLLDEYANRADLKAFLRDYRPDLSDNTTFRLETIDGGQNPQDPSKAGGEANLDIQLTVGLASGVPVIFVSTGNDTHDGDLGGSLDFPNYLLSQSSTPQVVSVSYGINEDELSASLLRKLCDSYMQLAARGTSVICASGDGGVAGGQYPPAGNCTKFIPTAPSGCPYVTAVGATTSSSTELAANFSSGGFSNVFPTPAFQQAAVDAYLTQLGSKYSGRYNATGRAYPDVSAVGENIVIVLGGKKRIANGTSASAPIFASIIALLNDRLIASGKPPLGWLNPLLYSKPEVFSDVMKGSSAGCGGGFPAESGWDPVTGLGTPDYQKLAAALGIRTGSVAI